MTKEYLMRLAKFSGRLHQKVAEDIVEHGKPHADRDIEFADVKEHCVELAALAFQVHEEITRIEAGHAVALAIVEKLADKLGVTDEVMGTPEEPV